MAGEEQALGAITSLLTGGAGSTLGSIIGGLGAGLTGNAVISGAMGDIQNNIDFNPFSGQIGGVGSFGLRSGGGSFRLDPALLNAIAQITGTTGGLLSGGLANSPDLRTARTSPGGSIAGAVDFANQSLGTAAAPFFNQSTFANNAANISGLGNIFANRVAQGGTDLSGGAFSELVGGGLSNLSRAGNFQGIVNQNLDASRALARPFEERLINDFANREFSATRGATTGAAERQFDVQNSLALADQQRIRDSLGLGLQEQGLLTQLGLGQVGQGQGFLGQNLAGRGQEIGAAQGFAQLGAGLEGQGFQQLLQSLQQNQSAGSQRLRNALDIFNAETGAFGQGVQLGQAGIGTQVDVGGLGLQGVLGLLNAEANRIGATGLSNQALAELAASQSGFLSGLF